MKINERAILNKGCRICEQEYLSLFPALEFRLKHIYLFGWVFGFNGKVQILAPESVKEQYRQMIAKADEDMQESE